MSGLGAWVLIAVVVLVLNRIFTAAAGADRRGSPRGPVGRARPPGSGAADEAAGARNPRSDATPWIPGGGETVVDLWREMQAALVAEREAARAGRRPRLGPDREELWMPGAASGASLESRVHGPRTAAPPAPAEPAAAGTTASRRPVAAPSGRAEARKVDVPQAAGAAPRGETQGPTAVSTDAAAHAAPRGLPVLSGRTPLQRAMIYAMILGPPVGLRREERRP